MINAQLIKMLGAELRLNTGLVFKVAGVESDFKAVHSFVLVEAKEKQALIDQISPIALRGRKKNGESFLL